MCEVLCKYIRMSTTGLLNPRFVIYHSKVKHDILSFLSTGWIYHVGLVANSMVTIFVNVNLRVQKYYFVLSFVNVLGRSDIQ